MLTRYPTMFSRLPSELLLEIIPFVPFSPDSLSSLRLTCHRLQALLQQHEHSLVHSIACKQLGGAPKARKHDDSCITKSDRAAYVASPNNDLFPNLKTNTFDELLVLHARLGTLDALHARWLQIVSHGPELAWLRGHWEGVHRAGLLLLYRLHDSGSYNSQVGLMDALPAASLACLAFKLVASIRILRVYGPEPIRGSYLAGDVLARSDVELAFEEMLLQHGPAFFVAMLEAGECDAQKQSDNWAVIALRTEVSQMIERQLPNEDGSPKPPTLTSCLRRAFAARLGCHFSEVSMQMWEILSSPQFRCLGHVNDGPVVSKSDMARAKLVALVQGTDMPADTELERGRKDPGDPGEAKDSE